MFDGPFWRPILLMAVLLVLPSVLPGTAATPPGAALGSAMSPDGQTITGLAMDGTGEYATTVVTVDPAKFQLGSLPGVPVHHDIYPCDFGSPSSTSPGACRPGLNHGANFDTTANGAAQTVDYISYLSSSGLLPVFAVGGPSSTISLWTGVSDVPLWETCSGITHGTCPASVFVSNVSVTYAQSRQWVAAAVAPTSAALPGSIELYDDGGHLVNGWPWNFTDSRPTTLHFSRDGSMLVVGSAATVSSPSNPTGSPQLFFFRNPAAAAPSGPADLNPYQTDSDVRDVEVSADGHAAVAGTAGAVYYVLIDSGTPEKIKYAQSVGPVQAVAISGDGERFAAAAGTKVYLYQASHDSTIAAQVGDAFDTGSTVSSVSYDATGKLLVAVAGPRVYGFGPGSSKPLWSFDATDPSHGGLDAPLQKVVVSDDAQRFVVAGETKVMPYRNLVTASGQFLDQQDLTVQPGLTQHFTLSVTNTGSLPDNYTFVARFPVGWTGIGPDPVSLQPDQSVTVPVSVDVPSGQSPGIYGVDVQVRSQVQVDRGVGNPAVADPALNFTIPRAIVLNVTTDQDQLPSLQPGGQETVPVIVRNRGNAEGVVNMTASQQLSRGSPWPLQFDQPQVRIPAGGEVTVNLLVQPSSDAASGDRDDITICAREGVPQTCQNDGSFNEATDHVWVYVNPKFGADLSAPNQTYQFQAGEIKTFNVAVTNTGNTDDVFNLTATITPATQQNDWRVNLDHDTMSVARGQTRSLGVTVRPGVSLPRDASLVIRAISNGSGDSESSAITLSLLMLPPTTTPTRTSIPGPGLELTAVAIVGAALLARRSSFRGGRR
jgi:hypothetical protein